MQKMMTEGGGVDGNVEGDGEGKMELGEGEAAANGGGVGCISSLRQGNCNVAPTVAIATAHTTLYCDRMHWGATFAFNHFLSRALPGSPIL